MKRKWILVIFWVIILSVSFIYADDFQKNIDEGIEVLSQMGLVAEDVRYGLDIPISRQAFVHILIPVMEHIVGNEIAVEVDSDYFKDTNSDMVLKAVSQGFLRGTSESFFSPEDTMTREQASVILSRSLEWIDAYYENEATPIVYDTRLTQYSDKDEVASWASNEFAIIMNNGIFYTIEDTYLNPKAALTYEQTIISFNKMLALYQAGEGVYFSNPQIGDYVRKVKNQPTGLIHKDDLTVMNTLHLYDLEYDDLSDLRFFENLDFLILTGSALRDLSFVDYCPSLDHFETVYNNNGQLLMVRGINSNAFGLDQKRNREGAMRYVDRIDDPNTTLPFLEDWHFNAQDRLLDLHFSEVIDTLEAHMVVFSGVSGSEMAITIRNLEDDYWTIQLSDSIDGDFEIQLVGVTDASIERNPLMLHEPILIEVSKAIRPIVLILLGFVIIAVIMTILVLIRIKKKKGYLLLVVRYWTNKATKPKIFQINLIKHSLLIGRDVSCNMTVDDPILSRQHFSIYYDQGHIFIEDMQSKNGTVYQGDKLIAPQILDNGSIVEAGNTRFEFAIQL